MHAAGPPRGAARSNRQGIAGAGAPAAAPARATPPAAQQGPGGALTPAPTPRRGPRAPYYSASKGRAAAPKPGGGRGESKEGAGAPRQALPAASPPPAASLLGLSSPLALARALLISKLRSGISSPVLIR
jgi:hypothetical protein